MTISRKFYFFLHLTTNICQNYSTRNLNLFCSLSAPTKHLISCIRQCPGVFRSPPMFNRNSEIAQSSEIFRYEILYPALSTVRPSDQTIFRIDISYRWPRRLRMLQSTADIHVPITKFDIRVIISYKTIFRRFNRNQSNAIQIFCERKIGNRWKS